MTDDKGAGEGPYRVVQPVDMIPLTVEGPTGNHGLMLQGGFLCNALNAAHAEGRKAAEKDFEELLEFANRLNKAYKNAYDGLNDMPVASRDFEDWKKARGIE